MLGREYPRPVDDGIAAPVPAGPRCRHLREPTPWEAGYAEEGGSRPVRRGRAPARREREPHHGLLPRPLAPGDSVHPLGHALPAADAQAVLDGRFRDAEGCHLGMGEQRVLRLGGPMELIHRTKSSEGM